MLEEYIEEDELEGYNIIKNKNGIHFISIDLFLKYIANSESSAHEKSLQEAFLMQFSAFISSTVLINKITNLHDHLRGSPSGLISFVNKWMLLKFQKDISNNSELKLTFKKYYELILAQINFKDENFNVLLPEIQRYYSIFTEDSNYDIDYNLKMSKGRKKSTGILSFRTEANVPKFLSNFFNILEWEETEIAKQLTLHSHKLFANIEYKELLSAAWTKRDKYTMSPNVMKFIERFNKMSYWLIEEILSYDKKKIRAQAIFKFLNVAMECKKLNNFNDCASIFCGVSNWIIKDLKKTWSVMPEEALKIYEELSEFCSMNNNFKNQRTELENASGKACLPNLMLLFKDLAFLEEGSKYLKSEFLINLQKIQKVHNEISFFLNFQSSAYCIKRIEELDILADLHPKSEDQLSYMASQIGKYLRKYFSIKE